MRPKINGDPNSSKKAALTSALLNTKKPDKWASEVTSIWKQKSDKELALSNRSYEQDLKKRSFDLLAATILKDILEVKN